MQLRKAPAVVVVSAICQALNLRRATVSGETAAGVAPPGVAVQPCMAGSGAAGVLSDIPAS